MRGWDEAHLGRAYLHHQVVRQPAGSEGGSRGVAVEMGGEVGEGGGGDGKEASLGVRQAGGDKKQRDRENQGRWEVLTAAFMKHLCTP